MIEINDNPLSSEKKLLINKLETLSYENVSIDEIFQILRLLLKDYEIKGMSTNSIFVLYRGIKYSEKPQYFSNIIYPPKE